MYSVGKVRDYGDCSHKAFSGLKLSLSFNPSLRKRELAEADSSQLAVGCAHPTQLIAMEGDWIPIPYQVWDKLAPGWSEGYFLRRHI